MELLNYDLEEIYFIKVTFKEIDTSDNAYFNELKIVKLKDFVKKIKSMGYKLSKRSGYNKFEFAVDNLLLIGLNNNVIKGNDWLGYIRVYGCFAAYEKNLAHCYKFIKDINDNIFNVKLFDFYDKEIKTDLQTVENFKIKIKADNEENYNHFIEEFGIIDDVVMCDEDFYNLYDKKYRYNKP